MTAQRSIDAKTINTTANSINGRSGGAINLGLVQRIGRAFAQVLGAKRVVVGHDARATSAGAAQAIKAGLVAAGVEVLDLGLCGAEEVFHATAYFEADGGIAATAQGSMVGFEGLKMVKAGAAPLDPETDLVKIRAVADYGVFAPDRSGGEIRPAKAARGAYLRSILSFVDLPTLRPMKILINAGNGAAGPTFDALSVALSKSRAHLSFICLNHDPDGTLADALSGPLPPEGQPVTSNAVVAAKVDMGIAWDGDFGRCFLFDHLGQPIASDSVISLLAGAFLAKEAGATIIHDPPLHRNMQAAVTRLGGRPMVAQAGPFGMQQTLRASGAVYGGAMSAHNYFRDFVCCNSGMIPWLLIAELMSQRGATLADLVAEQIAA